MVGSIAVASILSTVASHDVISVLIFIVFCVASVAFLTLGITTEIHVTSRTITKTWKTFTLVRNKVYPLDDYATAEILDRSQLIEGYPLSLFIVALVGSGRRIKVYSTDDPEDAKAVRVKLLTSSKKQQGRHDSGSSGNICSECCFFSKSFLMAGQCHLGNYSIIL